MAALLFLLPTGHSPSGRSGLDSKLISLLPLDEVPVHVPLRRPRPLRFERLRVGGEGKADANLTNFLSTCCAWAPQLACHALGRLPTPPPLPENLLLGLHRKLPSAPPASTTCKPHSSRGRGRPELGPSRLRDHGSISGLISGVIFGAISGVICELISGAAPSSLLPTGQENILVMTDSRSGRSSFDSKLISLLPLDDVPVHVHHFAARVPCDSKGIRE